MVQGKKQLNSKPKFAEVVIGDNEAKEMRESAKNSEPSQSLFKIKLSQWCDTNSPLLASVSNSFEPTLV